MCVCVCVCVCEFVSSLWICVKFVNLCVCMSVLISEMIISGYVRNSINLNTEKRKRIYSAYLLFNIQLKHSMSGWKCISCDFSSTVSVNYDKWNYKSVFCFVLFHFFFFLGGGFVYEVGVHDSSMLLWLHRECCGVLVRALTS